MRLLLTGGCGFIGAAVIRLLVRTTIHQVLNLDRLSYAASEAALEGLEAEAGERYRLIRADIADAGAVREAFAAYQPDAVMHLAAETHVDRSIDDPMPFVQANIVGTAVLLAAARDYWAGLPAARRAAFRFHHVSTDEVFGTLGPQDPPFTPATPYAPRSPYAASKAAADHLVRAWHHTYGLPVLISHATNTYGPWQFPDKLIPLLALNALAGRALPIYGDGQQRRDWLFVEDHAAALLRVLEHGVPGQSYAIGARQPRSNLQVAQAICAVLDDIAPNPAGPHARLIRHVPDRPGHDARYEIDPTHSEAALGWRPRQDFETGLRRTLRWYLDHRPWCKAVQAGRYAGQRLGLPATPEPAP